MEEAVDEFLSRLREITGWDDLEEEILEWASKNV